MIKLIGIDCDDTILDSNKNITNQTIEAIKEVNKKGIKCVLTTGRPFVKGTVEYYCKLGIYEKEQYYIAYNGAAIYNVYEGKELYSLPLSGENIREIHDCVKNFAVSHYIHKKGSICYDVMNEYTYLEKKFNDIDLIQIDFNSLSQDEKAFKYMLGGEPKLIKEIYEKVPTHIKEKYHVVISMPCFLEFMDKRVNKWNGLKVLSTIIGIKEEEIMSIGDSMNDYEMIKNAHIGVAMDNALPRIKEIADYVTSSNDDDGVGKIIKKLLL